jgi:hypothetical protein
MPLPLAIATSAGLALGPCQSCHVSVCPANECALYERRSSRANSPSAQRPKFCKVRGLTRRRRASASFAALFAVLVQVCKARRVAADTVVACSALLQQRHLLARVGESLHSPSRTPCHTVMPCNCNANTVTLAWPGSECDAARSSSDALSINIIQPCYNISLCSVSRLPDWFCSFIWCT